MLVVGYLEWSGSVATYHGAATLANSSGQHLDPRHFREGKKKHGYNIDKGECQSRRRRHGRELDVEAC